MKCKNCESKRLVLVGIIKDKIIDKFNDKKMYSCEMCGKAQVLEK